MGRIQRIEERIAEFVPPGDRVLEIGCGTGTLALLCAQQGAEVIGIDASGPMLLEAQNKVQAAGLAGQVQLQRMDATMIADHFEPASFDLVVSTLVLSEMAEEVQAYVLAACKTVLKPAGRLLLADEIVPEGLLARLLFYLLRLPLVLITWLITRTSTTALRGFSRRLAMAGFAGQAVESYLGGSLQLFQARPVGATLPPRKWSPRSRSAGSMRSWTTAADPAPALRQRRQGRDDQAGDRLARTLGAVLLVAILAIVRPALLLPVLLLFLGMMLFRGRSGPCGPRATVSCKGLAWP